MKNNQILLIESLFFRHKYHELLALGALFVTHLFDFRRGVEGVSYLNGDAWEFMELKEGKINIKAFVKVVSERSKNNQDNSEDPDDFGIIPNMTMPGSRFNPAKIFDFFLKSRNPKQERLHQLPQRHAKWFNLDNFEITCFFEDAPIGVNMVRQMLKTLCAITGQPKFTNHSLRATGICILKDFGFDDRTIAKLTGNKKILAF